jgi:hypothetical protein
MSWDRKGQCGPYYYRSIRQGDRVVKQYVGRGIKAEEAAHQIDERRKERQAQREVQQIKELRIVLAEQRLHDLERFADLLMRTVLDEMGYHDHKGQWRRRRHARTCNDDRESQQNQSQTE